MNMGERRDLDERVKLPTNDPEAVLRALLKVDPNASSAADKSDDDKPAVEDGGGSGHRTP
jgi:hypothetical protein